LPLYLQLHSLSVSRVALRCAGLNYVFARSLDIDDST